MPSHSSVPSASDKRKYTKAWKSLCGYCMETVVQQSLMLQLSGDKYFSGSQAELQNMPPIRGTLVQHKLRTHVQSIVWTMAGVAKPSLPSHVQYACWTEHAVGLSSLVTKLDPAPVAVVELVRYNCSSSKCKKMNMVCTDLPKCAFSEQYDCENVDSSSVGHDSDAEELTMTDNHDIFIE